MPKMYSVMLHLFGQEMAATSGFVKSEAPCTGRGAKDSRYELHIVLEASSAAQAKRRARKLLASSAWLRSQDQRSFRNV